MKDKFLISSVVCAFVLSGCVNLNSVERKQNFSYSPLHTAVFLNNEDVISSIVTKENIDIKDNFGDTPLIDAVRNNFTQTAKILICNGADKNVTDSNKLSLIDLAIRNNNAQIINMLKDENQTFCKADTPSKINAVATVSEVKVVNNEATQNENSVTQINYQKLEPKQPSSVGQNNFLLVGDEHFSELNEPEIATKLKEYSTEKYVYRDKIDGELIDDKFLDAYIGEDDKVAKKSSKKSTKENVSKKSKITKETKQTQKNDLKVEINEPLIDTKPKIEPKKIEEKIVAKNDDKPKQVEIDNNLLLAVTPKIEEVKIEPIIKFEQKNEVVKNESPLVVKNGNKQINKSVEKKQENKEDNKKEQNKIIEKPLTVADKLQIIALQNYIRFDKSKSTFTTSHAILDKKFKLLLDKLTSSIFDIANKNNKKIKQIIVKSHTSSEHRLTTNVIERNYLNLILSQTRADEILQYLLNVNIDKSIIVAKGFGSKFPILNEDGTENQELSRRTEIEVVFDE